ncbi:MAG: Uncharacterized protein XD69_1482 [Clostridia bacterium 62_21]|nr:MAG: Uncharacterized protein XD69_1482 [Clostridia bacterium 62_21]
MRTRFLAVLALVALLVVAVAGCGQSGPQSGGEKKVPVVGVTQIVRHPALDLDYQGFVDQMAKEGFVDGETVKIIFKDAQGDPNLAKTIADQFVADKVDAILSITTPSSQAAAQAAKGTGIPVVFIAVSDAVGAGLIKEIGKPTGTNITGVYSADPVEQQMDLIEEVVPNVKRLGLIYNAGEDNSVSNANRIKAYVKNKNWQVIEATVTGTSDVQAAAQSLVGRVDAVFVPQDNTVIAALEALLQVCRTNKIPFFCGDTESVKRGAIGTVGNDEYDCGAQGAEIMARILRGEDPGTIVPQEIRKRVLLINKKAADAIGLEIPKSVLERADEVIE